MTPSLPEAVVPERLFDTAEKLIAVPSRTGEAGACLDALADLLRADGFAVSREAAGHPAAPAVLVRLDSGRPGRTLQFDGHLDTVHLPFSPPRREGGRLTGSGAADMKGGTAAAIEALRVLRDTNALTAGSVLFVAHDLHEAPWGLGEQLDHLIRAGIHGDAVLIPEPLTDHLPVVGRGAATWRVTFSRKGDAVHEVVRPKDEPSVIAAGAMLVARLGEMQQRLAHLADPRAGHETVFVGQIHSGEIYNQYPKDCLVEGTRRWLPGVKRDAVEAEFRALLAEVAAATGADVSCEFRFIRDAFFLDVEQPIVKAFQAAYSRDKGTPLATGPKAFVDDGNSFYGLANVPAITHGPKSGGQHTVNEWVEMADMVRVARVYAETAVRYCGG